MSDLVERLRSFDCITMNGCGDDLRKEAADRITALETGITEALRSRDEDMRPILRKALHGADGK